MSFSQCKSGSALSIYTSQCTLAPALLLFPSDVLTMLKEHFLNPSSEQYPPPHLLCSPSACQTIPFRICSLLFRAEEPGSQVASFLLQAAQLPLSFHFQQHCADYPPPIAYSPLRSGSTFIPGRMVNGKHFTKWNIQKNASEKEKILRA